MVHTQPEARRRAPAVRRLLLTLGVFAAGSLTVVASSTTPSAAATDPVIAAVGDIACDPANGGYNGGLGTSTDCRQKATAALLQPGGPVGPVDAVFQLGDEQYNCGGATAFSQVYKPTWGAQDPVAHPVPGNHEYQQTGGTGCSSVPDAAGYFGYFGPKAGDPAKGYYSFNLGAWHIVALNSELCFGQTPYDQNPVYPGCQTGSAQETWLRADLAANTTACTLAYWHEPRFSSTSGKGDDTLNAFFTDLYNAHADVVLTAHQHWYERFALQNPSGKADANGIRQFIVGTGGESLMSLSSRAPNSEVANDKTFGVLKMALHASSYDWSFVPVAGSTFTDSGTTSCHGTPPTDTIAPTTTVSCNASACSSGWYGGTQPVTVTLSATDTGGSGVASTRYTTDGSDPTVSSTAVTYTGPFFIGAKTTVRYSSTDKAGNVEPAKSQQLLVDTVPPTSTITCNSTTCGSLYAAPVTVALSATDGGDSGVSAIRYTTDGSDPTTSTTATTYAGPFTVSSTTTVRFSAVDVAGNVEAAQSQALQIGASSDTTPPVTTISCNGSACTTDWSATTVSVELTATDSGGSGVARTRYTTDGSDPTTSATALTYTAPFTVAGTATVRYYSVDKANNAEAVQSQLVRVDTTAPTTTAAVSCAGATCPGANGWFRTSPVTLTLSATDGTGSGVAATRYTTDGSDPATSATAVTYTAPLSVSSTTTVRFSSTDNVGNVESAKTQAVQIDTIAPTTPVWCGTDPCGATAYPSPVTISLPASDAGGSGLATTRYTTDGSSPLNSPTAKTYTGPFSISQTTTIMASSTDNAGNVEAVGSTLVQVTGTGTVTPGGATLTPTDDSYTAKGNPTGTHGSEKSVNVNSGSSERRTYLKFNVTGIPVGASSITATLKLYAQSGAGSTVTFTVSQVATAWSEKTLTWNNQPALGSVVTTRAGLTNGAYNPFDVSALVGGNGTYAVAVTDDNTTQRYFNSKEAASNPPQLALTWVVQS